MRACLASQPIDSNNIFLYHKTTDRSVYDNSRKEFPGYDDVLLSNERGELTEFTIGNLVVEMDGELFTPPVSCGLLPGTFRGHLLETGQVKERIILLEEIDACSNIFLVNSVRKWQKVELITK
jgi:para-aminobenzoate synthetase/4-amino-4-deoxychorismate lyase